MEVIFSTIILILKYIRYLDLWGVFMKTLFFKKYIMEINLGQSIALIGPENCGKTTIFKMLTNKVKNDTVYLDNKKLNDYNIEFLKKNVMCVFDIEDFFTDYVKEELAYLLKKLKFKNSEISFRISQITNYFHLQDIIDIKISNLNVEEKALIKILSFLIVNPLIFGIDNLFGYISLEKVRNILNYSKERDINIIFATTDIEKVSLADEICVIDKFRLIKSGLPSEVFGDRIIRNLGLDKPFLDEINEFLHDYDLIKDDLKSINDGVNTLWK